MASLPSAYPQLPLMEPEIPEIPEPEAIVSYLTSYHEYLGHLESYFKSLEPIELYTILGATATLGVGSAALYFCSGSSSPEKKQAIKLANRAAFEKEVQATSMTKVVKIDKQVEAQVSRPKVEAKHPIFLEKPEKQVFESIDLNGNPVVKMVEFLPSNNVLTLKQCPRGRKTPCIAPFPLKLETFLRVHRIRYELDFNGYEPKKYGSPWIRFNSEDITESQNVVQFLIDTYGLKEEAELSSEQKALAIAYTHLLENHLYWGIALWRWVYDGARSLKEIQLLPRRTQRMIPDVCKTVEQAAWYHGIGKMNPEEVKKAVLKDLGSLSDFLGNKKYFLNTELPTELDCTAFGMLAQFLWNMKGPFYDAVAENHKNLREFCWRMRLNFWPDWEDCLNNTEFYSNEPYPTAESNKYRSRGEMQSWL